MTSSKLTSLGVCAGILLLLRHVCQIPFIDVAHHPSSNEDAKAPIVMAESTVAPWSLHANSNVEEADPDSPPNNYTTALAPGPSPMVIQVSAQDNPALPPTAFHVHEPTGFQLNITVVILVVWLCLVAHHV
jgi:hypothetical protein